MDPNGRRVRVAWCRAGGGASNDARMIFFECEPWVCCDQSNAEFVAVTKGAEEGVAVLLCLGLAVGV
jgi:hypothetical protein